jgi:hypothetical protein
VRGRGSLKEKNIEVLWRKRKWEFTKKDEVRQKERGERE